MIERIRFWATRLAVWMSIWGGSVLAQQQQQQQQAQPSQEPKPGVYTQGVTDILSSSGEKPTEKLVALGTISSIGAMFLLIGGAWLLISLLRKLFGGKVNLLFPIIAVAIGAGMMVLPRFLIQ